MRDEFTGNPAPLSDTDFERAALVIGCSVAAVRAVAEVESQGGFLPDGRPKILFERHKFHRFTSGAFSSAHPAISNPAPGGYLGNAAEYGRLAEAIALDREAALKSASWGAFQIMGFNHTLAGHTSVESFVKAMVSGQSGQLDAFVSFIRKSGLSDELVRKDWAGFARGYNGKDYAKNRYDTKLAAAFTLHSLGGARTDNSRQVLRLGDTGSGVKLLQTALGLVIDGKFGPETNAAVVKLQKARGLHTDGVVGQRTWEKLLPEG